MGRVGDVNAWVALQHLGNRTGLLEGPSRSRDADMRAQLHEAKRIGVDALEVPQLCGELSESDLSDDGGGIHCAPSCLRPGVLTVD